jgi:hypothetical protein
MELDTEMRPLAHLGTGPDSEDYKLYQMNESLYDTLSDRGEELLEAGMKEFMGHYYGKPPLATLKELKENFERVSKSREHMVKLRVPKKILDGQDNVIVEIYKDIQNKNYGSMSDKVYKSYREAYYTRLNDWIGSDEKDKILKEIFEYNENEYNKINPKLELEPR